MAFLFSCYALFALKKVVDQMPLKEQTFSFPIALHLQTSILPLAKRYQIVV